MPELYSGGGGHKNGKVSIIVITFMTKKSNLALGIQKETSTQMYTPF